MGNDLRSPDAPMRVDWHDRAERAFLPAIADLAMSLCRSLAGRSDLCLLAERAPMALLPRIL